MTLLLKTMLLLLIPLLLQAQPLPRLIPYLGSDGKWGYCDSNGRVVIRPQWEEAGLFKNGRAQVTFQTGGIPSRRYATIDMSGNYIIPPERRWTGTPVPDTANYELIREHRLQSLPGEKMVWSFGDYEPANILLNAQDSVTGNWGLIDTNNNIILPLQFEHARATLAHDRQQDKFYIIASRKGRWGIIDFQGNEVLPFAHAWLRYEAADTSGISLVTPRTEGTLNVLRVINQFGADRLGREFTWLEFVNDRWLGHLYIPNYPASRSIGLFAPDGRAIVPPGDRSIYSSGHVFTISQSNGIGPQPLSSMIDRDGNPATPNEVIPGQYSYQAYRKARRDRMRIYVNDTLTNQVNFEGKTGFVSDYLSDISVDPPPGNYYSVYFPHEDAYAVVSDSGRMLLKPQRYQIVNFVGAYIQILDSNARPVLIDTAGKRVSIPVSRTSRIAGLLHNKGRVFLLNGGHNWHWMEQIGNEIVRRDPSKLDGNWILDDKGDTVCTLEKYSYVRPLYRNEQDALGRRDVLFAVRNDGRVGLIDLYGKVTYPAVSFRYHRLQLVLDASDLTAENLSRVSPRVRLAAAPARPVPSRLRGCFMVATDQNTYAYFRPDGSAPLPALNFRFSTPIQPFGNRFWYASERGKGLRIFTDKNEDAVWKAPLKSIQPLDGHMHLYRLNGNDNTFIYASGTGLIYREAGSDSNIR